MLKIGSRTLTGKVLAAPMAGISDLPYRRICRGYGAALTPSEMVTSRLELLSHARTMRKLDYDRDGSLVAVQLVGADPLNLATAARVQAELGADIVDINMGCPAKKVCNVSAGSALLQHERLVDKILNAVVTAVEIPVTLKIRTGESPSRRNAMTIAQIAEQAGISLLAVHGRSRQCKFAGQAEYETIAAIKQTVSIPIVANGDIDSPIKAQQVLELTGADAVMIGRGALGQPWLFSAIDQYLKEGRTSHTPSPLERFGVIFSHIRHCHSFYGVPRGVLMARKHIKWYLSRWAVDFDVRFSTQSVRELVTTKDDKEQTDLLEALICDSGILQDWRAHERAA